MRICLGCKFTAKYRIQQIIALHFAFFKSLKFSHLKNKKFIQRKSSITCYDTASISKRKTMPEPRRGSQRGR